MLTCGNARELEHERGSVYLRPRRLDHRSGPAKLNSGISGNSGHSAGPMTVWQAGVRDEISEEGDGGAQAAS